MFNEKAMLSWVNSWGEFGAKLPAKCWKNYGGYAIGDHAIVLWFAQKPNIDEHDEEIAKFSIKQYVTDTLKSHSSERTDINIQKIKEARLKQIQKEGYTRDTGTLTTFSKVKNSFFNTKKLLEFATIMGKNATFYLGDDDLCPIIAYPIGTYDIVGILMPVKMSG